MAGARENRGVTPPFRRKGKGPKMGPGRRSPRGHFRDQIFSALDLGTNNCRLLVARPARNGFQVVDAFVDGVVADIEDLRLQR